MVSWRQSLPSHTSKYSTTGNWEESRLITADLGVYEASVQMWSGPVLKQQQSLGVGVTQLTSILHETYTEIPGSEDSVSSWLKKPRLVWDWVSRRCDTKLTFISLSTARGHSNNTKQTSLARRVGTNFKENVYWTNERKIVYWTCLISIECSLNCAAVATQRLFCIELLLRVWWIARTSKRRSLGVSCLQRESVDKKMPFS